MHALAQLSTLVFLQLTAEWVSVTNSELTNPSTSSEGQRYHRCSPPRSLGLLQHLYVLRFLYTMRYQAYVLGPDDVDLPALDPALVLAHTRLLRAVQTGCSIQKSYISMMRNRIEDDHVRALEMRKFC